MTTARSDKLGDFPRSNSFWVCIVPHLFKGPVFGMMTFLLPQQVSGRSSVDSACRLQSEKPLQGPRCPTSGVRTSSHKRSVCRSSGHRIKSRPHPAAATIKALRTELDALKKTKPAMKVYAKSSRHESRQSKAETTRKRPARLTWKSPRRESPVRQKFVADCHDANLQIPDSEKAAAAWLLDRRWATRPNECSGCGS